MKERKAAAASRTPAISAAAVFLSLVLVLLQARPGDASPKIHLKGEWTPPEGTEARWIPFNNETLTYLMPSFGSSCIGTQFIQWIYAYATKYLDFTGRFTYVHSGFGYEPDMFYLNTRQGMFMTNERYMNSSLRREWPDTIQFPLAVQPLMFTYNVSDFTVFGLDPVAECIHLTVELLADIYLGYVTHWNDPRILALNPILAPRIGNQTIVPIGYYGREMSTYAISSAFWQHSARFRRHFKEPFYYWPQHAGAPPLNPNLKLHNATVNAGPTLYENVNANLTLYENVYATFSVTRDTPGGLGYMPFAVYAIAGGGKAQFVVMEHQNATLIPTREAVMRAYEDTRLDEFNIMRGIDTHRATWPFSTVTVVHYVEDAPQAEVQCPKDRYMWQFMRWLYVDEVPQASGDANGIMALPAHIREEVVRRMERVVCYGDEEPLLSVKILDDHGETYFHVLLALSIVCILVFEAPGVALCFTSTDKGKRQPVVVVIYMAVLLLGALVCYLSVVFFYLVPDATWVCQARQWVLGVGAALFLGTLCARVTQMYRIYRMAHSDRLRVDTSESRMIRQGLIDFAKGVLPVVAVQCILLSVWTAKDALVATLTITDDILREGRWVCKSDDVWLWIGLEIGFFFLIAVYGVFVVFSTLDNKAKFSDARWMFLSIFLMLMTGAMFIPILAIVEIRDDNLFVIVSAAVLFNVSQMLFFSYVPKFGRRFATWVQRFRDRSSETTGSSQRSSKHSSKLTAEGNSNSV